MAESVTKTNVGISLSPEGMVSTARTLDRTLSSTIRQLNKAAETAKQAVGKSAEAGQAATTQMNAQLKAMAITLGQVKTLQGALQASSARGGLQSAQLLGNFAQTASIGKQAAAMAQYKNSLIGASSAMSTLKDRVNQFSQASGILAKNGQLLSQGQLFKKEKIEATAKAYSKVNNEIGSLRGRIALLSSDGQKAFQPMLKELGALEKANASAFSNRRRSNFDAEVTSTQKVTRSIKEQLVLAERKEKAGRLNLETLRAEVAKRAQLSTLEREAALATSVRAANSRYNNTNMIGGIQRSDIELASRYEQLVSRAAVSRNRLTAAENAPNTSAARLQRLIALHDAYQRELGESIAAQSRLSAAAAKTPAPSGPANAGGFVGGLKSSAGNLFGGEEGGAYGAGALVGRVGAYALAAGAVYGIITALKSAISFTIEFEDQLAQLQAISGSTDLEMRNLSDSIIEVSKSSTSSVLELSKSATIIAQAGYATEEIGGLLKNVVNLAGASGSSTDEAVDILTSALGSFQLAASEATSVTDALVAALNDSKLSVNQVQLGLQYVGATAKLNNITFNELVATLGAMADAGIRSGSTMSTGLRQMLVDFIEPSKKLVAQLEKVGLTTADIDVKVLGLTTVLTRLRDSGFQAYGALETRAAAAYSVLGNNVEQIQKLELATLRQGVAEEAQLNRLDSLGAKWQILMNTLSETGAILSKLLLPALKLIVDIFTGLAIIVNSLISPIGKLIDGIAKLGGYFNDTSINVDGFRQSLLDSGLTTEEVDAALESLGNSLEDVESASKNAQAQLDTLRTKEATLKDETEKLITRKDDLAGSTSEVAFQVDVLSNKFPGLRTEFSKTEGGINGLITAMVRLEDQAKRTLITQARVVRQTQREVREQANKEASGVSSSVSSRVAFATSRAGLDESSKKDIAKFGNLMANKNFDKAVDFVNTLPSNHVLRKDYQFKELTSRTVGFRAKYESARALENNADAEIRAGEFSLSEEGKRISNDVRQGTAYSTRAASQGTADGKSRDTLTNNLNSSISNIENLEKKYADDPAILSFLGGAKSSQKAAIARMSPDAEKADKKKGGRSKADRAARNFARSESTIQKEELEYRKKLYENQLDALENAPTLDDIPDLLTDVDESLSNYLNAEKESSLAAIEKSKPTDAQKTKMLQVAADKSEELRIESIDKIAGVLSKAIKEFVDRSTKAIERQYDEALRFTGRNAALARSRATGLDNPVGTSDVSNSFRVVKNREAEIAEDRYNKAQIPANDRRISQYENTIEETSQIISDLEMRINHLGKIKEVALEAGDDAAVIVVTAQMDNLNTKFRESKEIVTELGIKTRDLKDSNEELKASYDLIESSPRTFSEGLKTAAEAVSIEINAASGIGQDIINNLDQPLRAAHASFKTFFSDILSGTASVGQAFASMAQSIIGSILDMAAQAAANQIFGLLANFAGAALGGGTGLGFLGGNTASAIGSQSLNILQGGLWRGGSIRGYARGGEIQSGMATRDSTIIKAAKGEFMMRKASVDSIGTPMLRAMNARGADALRAVAPTQGMAVPVLQNETNVYVIAPEEKPTLGPNDVLAILSNDVLKGGSTKKLIKRVANGG